MNKINALLVAAILAMGLSVNAMDSETEKASKALGAEMATEITFDPGQVTLSDSSKSEIRDLIHDARAKGDVEDVKIAVWADREYPMKEKKASKEDVALAAKRGDALKEFIKKEMDIASVNTYNMTERPNALQQFLKTPEAKVKDTLEARGAAPKSNSETGIFGENSKSSKAVIMVYQKL